MAYMLISFIFASYEFKAGWIQARSPILQGRENITDLPIFVE